jgi:hypothetical protein
MTLGGGRGLPPGRSASRQRDCRGRDPRAARGRALPAAMLPSSRCGNGEYGGSPAAERFGGRNEGPRTQPADDYVGVLIHYALGMPENRLAQWQSWASIPLAAFTQFERVEAMADAVRRQARRPDALTAPGRSTTECEDADFYDGILLVVDTRNTVRPAAAEGRGPRRLEGAWLAERE